MDGTTSKDGAGQVIVDVSFSFFVLVLPVLFFGCCEDTGSFEIGQVIVDVSFSFFLVLVLSVKFCNSCEGTSSSSTRFVF